MFSIKIDSYQYPGCREPTLKNIYLELPENGLYIIKGDNGSGKTTLSLLIFGIIPNLIKGKLSGEVRFKGSLITVDNICKSFAYLFQNPLNYFSCFSIREEIALMEKPDELALKLISDINLDLPFTSLSLGQQQKIALASILYSNKSCFFLDEPFEFIDNRSGLILEKILNNKLIEGKTIFINEQLYQNRFKLIENSNIIFIGDGTLLKDTPKLEKINFIIPQACQVVRFEFSVEDIYFKFAGQKEFFLKIPQFNLTSGKIIGVVGYNGSGKSTLFYILSGLIKSKRMKIYFNGEKINNRKLRQLVKLSIQNPDFQLFHSTVYDEIVFALKNSWKPRAYIEQCISKAKILLPFNMKDDPSSLSFGQKKLLTIYITYFLDSEIIILDEPFATLDNRSIHSVFNLLADLIKNDKSVLISSHNIEALNICCHEIIEICGGSIEKL